MKSSISEAVEGGADFTPPSPRASPRDSASSSSSASQQRASSDSSDWSKKRIKVKQYLAKRYELDLESPSAVVTPSPSPAPAFRFSVDSVSDDVFSPSPGVFSKAKAFSFSPERDRKESTSGAAHAQKSAMDLSMPLMTSQRQRKIDQTPLYLRTSAPSSSSSASSYVTPRERIESSASLDEPETPVFLSPAPQTPSSASPHQGTFFQFQVPSRSPASLDRGGGVSGGAHIPVSPLALSPTSAAKSRSSHGGAGHVAVSQRRSSPLSQSKQQSPKHHAAQAPPPLPSHAHAHSQLAKAHSFPSQLGRFLGTGRGPGAPPSPRQLTEAPRVQPTEAAGDDIADRDDESTDDVPMASSSSPMAVAREQRQQQVASAAPRGDVIMPTIREYIQHQHQVVRHQRRHAERAADRDHRAVTSPPSSSSSRMDAVSSTPDDDVAALPPLIAMLRHPAFSHSAAAAATAGRVPPLHPLTPFQSYAGAPPLPGRWRSIQFQKLHVDKSVCVVATCTYHRSTNSRYTRCRRRPVCCSLSRARCIKSAPCTELVTSA